MPNNPEKILVVYASRHGATESCAKRIHAALGENAVLHNLADAVKVSIQEYDFVILGGSIHAGTIQKKVRQFLRQQFIAMMQKKVALFLCCMEEGDKAAEQFKKAFPEPLIKKAVAIGLLGGVFDFEKMNMFESFLVKKIAKVDKSVSKLSEENLQRFIEEIKN
ncbi:MAG: hypothetical protein A2293_07520 [Elusimicrobia bacterium RIFOXYB2_FULL_49_7]|nr:MAG: hypothetical protein A2293_07520 [Elusimicrobia bacterium RIFOXYB2_FULL_49_7]